MINKIFILGCGVAVVMGLFAGTWTDPKTGIEWRYMVKGQTVSIGWGLDSFIRHGQTAIPTSIIGNVEIPSQIDNKPVSAIDDFAFAWCTNLTSVVIPSGVTSVGLAAFKKCTRMSSISIPLSVTNIGYAAFSECGALGSGVIIVDGCVLTVNDSCPTSFDIPPGTRLVAGAAFGGCKALESVTIPSSVLNIGNGAFYETGLTSVVIPSSIKRINGSTFGGCREMTSVVIPSSVTSVADDAFSQCTLRDVTVPGWQCAIPFGSVTNVAIAEGTKEIADCAFLNCSSVKSVLIPSSVTSIGESAFKGCGGLLDIAIPDGVTNVRAHVFEGCSGLVNVSIPTGVTTIGDRSFYGCSGLEHIEIPAKVTNIGEWAFYGCNRLTSVVVPDASRSMRDLFPEAYRNLTNIVVSGGSQIAYAAFSDCSRIESFSIPSSVTSIGACAFSHCSALLSITIPPNVRNFGNQAFAFCNGLTSVTIPANMEVGKAWGLFEACSNLTSVSFSPGLTSIGSNMFQDCCNLRTVTIPPSVEKIGYFAFYGCKGLGLGVAIVDGCVLTVNGECPDFVELPLGTRLIASDAFAYCNGLKTIRIPSSVTTIGEDAFYRCSGLTTVFVDKNDEERIRTLLENSRLDTDGLSIVSTCTVSFVSGMDGVMVESIEANAGEEINELPTLECEGYDFVGWFTAAVGGEEVSAETVVTADVTYFAQWKAQETDVPTYGPWGEGEDVANPDKLGPTYLQDMTLTINGAAGAMGDVVAVYRTDTDAVCGLGKVLDDSGTLTAVCYAPTGTTLHFKVWIAASGVTEPTVLDCDKKCDLVAPTSGSFYSGHALVVSDDKELTLTLKNADWHTVSFNVVPDDPSPAAVFADVADRIAAVTQGVNYWMPGKAGTLKQIEIGKGYWVKTKSANVSWTVSGKTNPSVEIPLVAGWNLIGYAPEDEQAVASVLKTALAEKAIDYVTYGVSFYPNGTLAKMSPGKAYWVHAKKAYTLVYDEVKSEKLKVKSVMASMSAAGGSGSTEEGGSVAKPRTARALTSSVATSTYGPFGESEDVANPDKLGPTMFTDVALTIDGEPAAVGDCVAVYRGDTGALCGLGKVLETPGELAIVCYAPQGVALTFKAWVSASGMAEPTVVVCMADTAVAPSSGEIVTEAVHLTASTQMPSYTVIAGAKCDVDVGLKGYATKTLPKGLSCNAKTGYVTGTVKTTGEYEVTFTKKNEPDEVMTFVVRAEATPTVACAGLAEGAFVVGVAGGASGIPLDIGAESGVKSVKATKLPTGMKLVQDKVTKNWSITGAPTKAGEYDVVIEVTSVAGGKASLTIHVEVAALPTAATGTFNGFVLSGGRGATALPDGETVNCGTLQVMVSEVGKVTAKVVNAAGTYSFAAAGWDSVSEGIYSVKMTTKKGENLELALDTAKGWNEHQLTGSFAAVGMAALSAEAQKNAFGKQWFFNATGDEKNGWALSFADNAKTAALTVTLNADGKTSVAGKLGSYKITASGYVDVSGIGSGALFADFAPVVTVGKSKKVLSLRANLWFDKKSDHENGVGSAVFVD